MHAAQLAQLACCLVTRGPIFLRTRETLPARSLQPYWTASKSRIDRWLAALRHAYGESQRGSADQRRRAWHFALPTLEETLQSELLSRLWAALGCLIDRRAGIIEAEPVLRSVLLGHGEARNRALSLVVLAQPWAPDQTLTVNRLRRKLERWNDALLALMQSQDDHHDDLAEFAHEPARYRELLRDFVESARSSPGNPRLGLLLASAQAALDERLSATPANPDLNARVAAGVLATFGGELFDSVGSERSLVELRLAVTSDGVQGMVDDLIDLDSPRRAAV